MNIIQVDAPTSACSEDKIEKLYIDLDTDYKQCGSQDISVDMGDLNAKVGQEHSLGSRNVRSDTCVGKCVTP